ncbi:hypothetical protein [Massilia glaciei]|uniref:General secretion pathway protein GspM n=1 Tax=Massilia glaciei TaxID=1524097 RepID=A0A2U2HJJ1_9BURK|nr:hypothetical protein [Massilia glaciei]PWF47718.1 hypothetical protein C7C56_014220 [Massilia glaciei]
MRRTEPPSVRRPLLICAAALLAAVSAVALSHYFVGQARDDLRHAAQARQLAAGGLAALETSRRETSIYQPRFMQLEHAGMVGDERRLAWTEAIRAIQAARKLPPLSFGFAPQQGVAMDVPMALGGYQLRASRMQLSMGLLHEMDLFNFLDALREHGLFTVQDCSITRKEGPAGSIRTARLAADCTLVWVTLADNPGGAR